MAIKTILFLSSSYPQSKTMIPVMGEIKKLIPTAEVNCVTLDSYYFQNSETPLEQNEIVYNKLHRPAGTKRYWDVGFAGRFLLLLLAWFEIKKLVKKSNPTLLVVGDDIGPIERLFINYQNRYKNGKTLLIQDGIINKEMFNPPGEGITTKIKNRLKEITRLGGTSKYGLGDCQYQALIGDETKDFLSNFGLKTETCQVTGSPRFDNYYLASKNLTLRYPPKTRKARIVYFSQPLIKYGYWSDDDWGKVKDILCYPTKILEDNYEFYIKLHPSDDRLIYERSITEDENCGKNFNIIDHMDASEAIDFADIVVVYRSTIAIESLFYKKIILFLDPWKDNDGYGIPANQAGFRIPGAEEYQATLMDYCNEKIDLAVLAGRMEESLEYLAFANDGKSSFRVAKYIHDILSY